MTLDLADGPPPDKLRYRKRFTCGCDGVVAEHDRDPEDLWEHPTRMWLAFEFTTRCDRHRTKPHMGYTSGGSQDYARVWRWRRETDWFADDDGDPTVPVVWRADRWFQMI